MLPSDSLNLRFHHFVIGERHFLSALVFRGVLSCLFGENFLIPKMAGKGQKRSPVFLLLYQSSA
jgi:hypothetical protein